MQLAGGDVAGRPLLSLSPLSTANASGMRSLTEQAGHPVCSLEFERCVHVSTDYIGKDAAKNRYLAICTTACLPSCEAYGQGLTCTWVFL